MQPFPFGSVNRAIAAELGAMPETGNALRDLAQIAANPPPTPSTSATFDFVFSPGNPGPLPPNVYTSWPALVAAANAVGGFPLVTLDDTYAPVVIPSSAAFTRQPIWRGNPERAAIALATPVTFSPGVLIAGVFHFRDVAMTSAVPVFVAPAGNSTYTLDGFASATGLLFTKGTPGIYTFYVNDFAELVASAQPVVDVTVAGVTLTAITDGSGIVGLKTLRGILGGSYGGRIGDPQGFIDPVQLTPVFPVSFGAQSSFVQYNDALVPPPLGVDQVQAAIDALKVIVAGGSPVHPGRYDLSCNEARVENASSGSANMITGTMLNEVGAFTGSGPAPAHTGNKAMLGFKGHSGVALGTIASIVWEWEEVAPTEPLPVLRYPYLNIVLELSPLAYKILVIDPNLAVITPALNLGALTSPGPGLFKFTHTPGADVNFVQVINFAIPQPAFPAPQPFMPIVSPPVPPAVVAGGSTSFKYSDIVAAFPAAKLIDVYTGDNGLPGPGAGFGTPPKIATPTPSMILCVGDSSFRRQRNLRITSVLLNGLPA